METKTEKQNVDVAAIVANANQKTKAVKDSTQSIQAKTNPFRIVPNFSKYEFNGIILRNEKTKAVIKFKTGRTKYQIADDKGKSHNLSNEKIKALMPSSKESPVKKDKSPKEKKVKEAKPKKEKKVPANLDQEKTKVEEFSKKEILDSEFKNHKKHYMLFLKGCSFEEIQSMTNKPLPSIKRDVWRYQTGKTVL